MAGYVARVAWSLAEGEDFAAGRYSRGHMIGFDEGVKLAGSASPHVVGARWSVAAAADPEEMLVASLSACHMLTFLHLARLAGFVVTSYRDAAEGTLAKNPQGRLAVSEVVLRPQIVFEGRAPDADELDRLHHAAHEECFIANSVTTVVRVEMDPT